jgi:hypothetical protein
MLFVDGAVLMTLILPCLHNMASTGLGRASQKLRLLWLS